MHFNRNGSRRVVAGLALLSICLFAGTTFAGDTHDGRIKAKKFYDSNVNGLYDVGEPLLRGWPMTLTSTRYSIDSTKNTDASGSTGWGSLKPGNDYALMEGTPDQGNWFQTGPVDVNGFPVNPVTGITLADGQSLWVKFGNVCMVPSGGRTPGFWSNRNGLRTMADDDSLLPELALLSSLNLVDANGLDFDPIGHPGFRSWLLDGDAVNMAYRLSTHLAAMALNVEAGFVDGDATFADCGCTVSELMEDANVSLGLYPLTMTGHPQRADQEQIKDWLDALNNNAAVVSSVPCEYTFGQ